MLDTSTSEIPILRGVVLVEVPDCPARRAIEDYCQREEVEYTSLSFTESHAFFEDAGGYDLVLFGAESLRDELPDLLSVLDPDAITATLISDTRTALVREFIAAGLQDYLYAESGKDRVETFIDLTLVRRQRRAKSRRHARANEYLLNAIPDLVIVLDRDGRYHEAISAEASESNFLRPPTELIGRKISEFFGQDQAKEIIETIERVLETGEPEVLYYSLSLDGQERWFAGHAAILDDEAKDRVVWIARDITERKEAQFKAEETATLLQAVLDTLPLGIFWKDREHRFLGMNSATIEAVGASSLEEVVGKTDHDFENTRTHADHYHDYDARIMESGLPELGILEQIDQGEGKTLWIRTNKVPLRGADGEVNGVLGTFEDISEERRLTLENEEARQNLEASQSLAKIGSWENDFDTNEVYWSPELYRIHDLPIGSKPLQADELNAYYKKDGEAEAFMAGLRALVQEGKSFSIINELTTIKGVKKVVHHQAEYIDGRIVRGTVQDITAEHRLRADLDEALRVASDVQAMSRIGFWEIDISTKKLSWGPETYKIHDWDLEKSPPTVEEIPTLFKRPEEAAQVIEDIRAMIENGEERSMIAHLTTPTGKEKIVKVVGRKISDKRVLGSIQDVTEEQQLHLEAKSAKLAMERAQALSKIGSWELSPEGVLRWSDELYRVHGLEVGSTPPPPEPSRVKIFYPEDDDQERFVAAIGGCIEDGIDANFEGWLHSAQGERRRVHLLASRDEASGYARGTLQDITALYRQDQALRSSQAFLKSVLDTIPIGVYWKDRESRFLGANNYFLRTAGDVRLEDIIGKRDEECGVPKTVAEGYYAEDREIIKSGKAVSGKVYPLSMPGYPPMWLRGSKVPLLDPDGTCIGVLGTFEDITEEKYYELERLRSKELLDSTQAIGKIGGWEFNVETQELWWTDETYRIFGLDPSGGVELEQALAFYPAESFAKVEQEFTRLLEDGIPYDIEVLFTTTSGEERWARAMGQPVFRDGKVVKAVGLLQDVTEQREATIERERVSELLSSTQKISKIGGWEVELAGESLYWTEQTYHIFGLSPENPIPPLEEVWACWPEEELERTQEAFNHCLETGEHYVIDSQMKDFQGRLRWTRSSGHVIYDEAGRIVKVVGTIEDIGDERRAAEERLAFEARVQHAQKLESLGVLAGGIAHDFNNLLVSMMGYASMALGMTPEDRPAHDKIANVVEAAKKAADLTKQMLAYSGKGKFVIDEVALNDLVHEMANILRVTLPKGVILKENFAQNLPTVSADKAQMSQVVMNLITNAGEAIGERSGIVTVSTTVLDADEDYLSSSEWDSHLESGFYVCLEVSDTGQGMDEETRAKIFDPFFTTKFTGRGLGLAAVLGIVRGHKGAIRIYSEQGRGTTFKILLPMSSGDVSDGGKKQTREMVAMRGRALVVDDEESVRAVARMVLEDAGMEVVTANDGRDGLEKFSADPQSFAVVLLDMTMPHMNGSQAYREMRLIDPDVKVVLSSGYTEQDATADFNGRGLAGFIQKPYLPKDLVSVVQAALGTTFTPSEEDLSE